MTARAYAAFATGSLLEEWMRGFSYRGSAAECRETPRTLRRDKRACASPMPRCIAQDQPVVEFLISRVDDGTRQVAGIHRVSLL
jgi:hypothetical protein